MKNIAAGNRSIEVAGPVEGSLGDYVRLLKPRVMSLVVFTALVGMVSAPGSVHPVLGFVALLCIAVGAGAAGGLNMWYEADIDAVMKRTRDRPLPAGRLDKTEALSFAAILAAGSVVVMGLAVNIAAALLLAGTIAFYVFVYTMWLKPRTPQNIVIGGAAGALPPVVGWAAVTGTVNVDAVILFSIIFFWTPPHFWALSLYRSDDYQQAGIPMLPVVAGDKSTRRQILFYTVILVAVSLAPLATGLGGALYAAAAVAGGVLFLAGAVRIQRERSERSAMQLFGFSIVYLFALFAALLCEHILGWAG